ncbi:hypothetical protein BROUX41_001105 [Berkeleyomyces rouxiae]
MARSEEAEAFFYAVWQVVQEIPEGKVTTYGHVAALLGTREPNPKPNVVYKRNLQMLVLTRPRRFQAERPRQVGTALKQLPVNTDLPYNHTNVPWQRVINAQGKISPRSRESGSRDQAESLRREGVEVSVTEMGEFKLDLGRYGWFPAELPSRARG